MQPPGQGHERNALVLYGSETNNAKELAEELGRMTERLRFSTRVAEMDDVNLNDLLKYSVVLFSISTTGQGEVPVNARTFWKKLRNARLKPEALHSLRFSSFGLGDSSYPQFNWASRKLYNRLRYLGAVPVHERGESDEQHPEGIEGCFLPWSIKLRQALLDRYPLPENLSLIPDDEFLVPKWALQINENANAHLNGENCLNSVSNTEHYLAASHIASAKDQSRITATLTKSERLTPWSHWQDVRLFEFLIRPQHYEPGDILTIFPKNSAEDVNHLLSVAGWSTDADKPCHFEATHNSSTTAYYPEQPLSMDDMTLRKLLTHHLDMNAIPRRSFFASIAHFTNDEMQKQRLLEFTNPIFVDELYDYTTRPRRSIVEVLQEFDTVKVPLQWAASIFPIIRGRQFSIASGGELKSDPDGNSRVQLLVAVVRYKTVIKKIREGLCTKYLASLSLGARLEVEICGGGIKHAIDKPAVMVGPGTGLAPLRSMLYERASAGQSDKDGSTLFFGGRNRSADFFFKDEWPRLQRNTGFEVCTAFSRDQVMVVDDPFQKLELKVLQKAKIYVQDRIRERGQAVYKALREGTVYICGSSGKMPQAVREALIEVFQEHGGMERAAAETYLSSMEKDGRYQQETW